MTARELAMMLLVNPDMPVIIWKTDEMGEPCDPYEVTEVLSHSNYEDVWQGEDGVYRRGFAWSLR